MEGASCLTTSHVSPTVLEAYLKATRVEMEHYLGVPLASIRIKGVQVRNVTATTGDAEVQYALPASVVGNDNWVSYGYKDGQWKETNCHAPIGGESSSTSASTATTFTCGVTSCATTAIPGVDAPSTAASVSSRASVPPEVLSRQTILARYAPTGTGVTVEFKLVSLASLTNLDPGLTQCEVRGCAPGQVVWMILYEASDNRFVAEHSTAVAMPGVSSTSPPQGPSFETFLVDADSGVGRGDSEAGAGNAPIYWSSLVDLASS